MRHGLFIVRFALTLLVLALMIIQIGCDRIELDREQQTEGRDGTEGAILGTYVARATPTLSRKIMNQIEQTLEAREEYDEKRREARIEIDKAKMLYENELTEYKERALEAQYRGKRAVEKLRLRTTRKLRRAKHRIKEAVLEGQGEVNRAKSNYQLEKAKLDEMTGREIGDSGERNFFR